MYAESGLADIQSGTKLCSVCRTNKVSIFLVAGKCVYSEEFRMYTLGQSKSGLISLPKEYSGEVRKATLTAELP
jgi:hypothetical protein